MSNTPKSDAQAFTARNWPGKVVALNFAQELEETLRDTQENYKVLLDAVEHEIRLRQSAEELLRRALRQLKKWQNYYGRSNSNHLPPSGDVRISEDIDEFLAPNAHDKRHADTLTEGDEPK